MKTTLALIAAIALSSCATPEQNARLAAIVDTALIIAARRGAITEQDAADVREAGKVILEQPAGELPAVDVNSTK